MRIRQSRDGCMNLIMGITWQDHYKTETILWCMCLSYMITYWPLNVHMFCMHSKPSMTSCKTSFVWRVWKGSKHQSVYNLNCQDIALIVTLGALIVPWCGACIHKCTSLVIIEFRIISVINRAPKGFARLLILPSVCVSVCDKK